MFDDQAGALIERGIRVVVCDLRGHGESAMEAGTRFAAQDALRDLDALLSPATIRAGARGHSLGGNLAQPSRVRTPDRVSGLIVLGSTWNTALCPRWSGSASGSPRLRSRRCRRDHGAPDGPGVGCAAGGGDSSRVGVRADAQARLPRRLAGDDLVRAADPTYLSPVPLGLVRGAEDRTGNIRVGDGAVGGAEDVRERVIPRPGISSPGMRPRRRLARCARSSTSGVPRSPAPWGGADERGPRAVHRRDGRQTRRVEPPSRNRPSLRLSPAPG
ncbi:alpha/beta hydrolase [Microbacterium barkeri]|uniref:alpha/beta hydrolase n=1 Tax=Microbacterium barkeri TaxID=33917 RepID=UPI003606DD2A